MNPLPYDRQRWAFARIVTAPTFALGVGPWQVQPMWSRRRKGYGFELIECTRAALPAIGEATFQYRFGLIDGDVVGISDATDTTRRVAANPWDPAVDAATAPDLRGYEVRIQLAPAVDQGVTPAWRTEWWGTVEYQEDTLWPGAKYPAGVRTYRCVDGFARTKRWPLNRHTTYGGSYFFCNVEGHPGYNVGQDGRIIGNRDTNLISSLPATEQNANPAIKELITIGDTGYKLHTYQGRAGALRWTVQEALEDALRKTRGLGDVTFSFSGSTALLADEIAIPVRDGDTAWDIVSRTCRRERGRGMVFVDWADDTANPTGTFVPRLTIRPQTLDDIGYTTPASGAGLYYIPGATTAGTTKAVDVIGDHRVMADDLRLGDRFLHVADAVETTSELIQVLVTLSYFDGTDFTFSKRWDATRETAFAALAAAKRIDEAWWPLWQLHGLPLGWDGTARDHNGGTAYPADFSCNDDGSLATSQTSGFKITSPILCRILPDLPLYEGYDYTTSSPKRKIGDQTTFDETSLPSRRPPLPLIRKASNRYITGDEVGSSGARSLSVQIRGHSLLVYSGSDRSSGLRVIGATATSGLGSLYNLSALGVTVGLELPHRIRRRTIRTGVATDQVRRTVSVRLPDLHLWLAHSGAIWDLDTSGRNGDGSTGKRGAGGAAAEQPGYLRDDRDALSRIHAMACAWYLSPRQTARWTLRACGMLPSFTAGLDGSETITYPRMGELITSFSAGGQINTLNTPVTSITYRHTDGRTTWETDWQELDTTA